MKAKPIGADSPESLQAALKERTADGFTPTLAIVFISLRQDCAAITEILTSQGIDVIYEMMADALNALLDNLYPDSCYIIGWSDGGINGLLLALRRPEKVKNLAITGANLWPDSTAVDSSSKVKQTPDVKNQYKLMAMMTKGNT